MRIVFVTTCPAATPPAKMYASAPKPCSKQSETWRPNSERIQPSPHPPRHLPPPPAQLRAQTHLRTGHHLVDRRQPVLPCEAPVKTCSIHHIPLTCARCIASERGRKGGAKRSEKQLEARRTVIAAVNSKKRSSPDHPASSPASSGASEDKVPDSPPDDFTPDLPPQAGY